ncbi:MAG: FAD:protein FMN transferase [Paludibacteraceae bacterium]|nr:FAD:protein FMN transferase [Paludibacteraceae bacterium]
MDRRKKIILAGIPLLLATVLLLCWPEDEARAMKYYHNRGFIFGTYYSIKYEASQDMEKEILSALGEVDSTFSMFNANSIISAINGNQDVTTTPLFEEVFATALDVSESSFGAFDITIAPLVNYWGFGFENSDTDSHTSAEVDSILQFVGYRNVDILNHTVYKADPRTQMDLSAIAKGLGCDQAAAVLQSHGCINYMVDIGGEIVVQGVNKKGKPWSVGIVKPLDDPDAYEQELMDTIFSSSLCMATSGNYRRFYYEGTEKRSHTIDPRTGYPVQHNLLSATIVASSCMQADALATACMVLGPKDALELIARMPNTACYLIVGEKDGMKIVTSPNWNY